MSEEITLQAAQAAASKMKNQFRAFEKIEGVLNYIAASEARLSSLKKQQSAIEEDLVTLKSKENRLKASISALVDKHADTLSNMDKSIKNKQADQRKRAAASETKANEQVNAYADQVKRETEATKQVLNELAAREKAADEATEKAEKRLASLKKSLENAG